MPSKRINELDPVSPLDPSDLFAVFDVSDDNIKTQTKSATISQIVTEGGGMARSTYDPQNIEADAFNQDNMTDGITNKNYTAAEKTKLANIEANADVTDASNVAAAGAVMKSDESTSGMSFVVDEDDMASNSATKIPTQQSVKAYVDDALDSQFINVKYHGVTGDGTTDDSAAINAVLSGGHKRVYFPAGRYRCKSYLRVYEYTEILLHPDAVIENDRSDGACLMFNGEAGNDSYATGYDGDGHIIIRGGTIDCSKRTAAESSSQAIAFAHAENIRIENVRFYNNKQDHFVEINSSKNVRIRDCTFETTVLTSPDTREAINIDYAGSSSFPHFGDDDGTVCEDVLIEGCTFINCDSAVGTHGEPAGSGRHKKIRVVNCYIKDCVSRAIDGRYWKDSVISGNTIDSDAGCQIRYTNSSESVIANNTLIGTSGSGIAGSSAAGIVISGNIVSTAANSIYAGGSRITIVGNSVISSNASVEAIMIDAVSNSTVTGNKVQTTQSTGYGIRLRAATSVAVTGNLIVNCNSAGILVGANGDASNSENCLVAMNRITSSGSPTNSILLGTKSVKTMRFGNLYTNGGSISDSGTGTITVATDSN